MLHLGLKNVIFLPSCLKSSDCLNILFVGEALEKQSLFRCSFVIFKMHVLFESVPPVLSTGKLIVTKVWYQNLNAASFVREEYWKQPKCVLIKVKLDHVR